MAELSDPGSTLPTGGVRLRVPGAAEMRDLGARMARFLGPGDLIVLAGPLGAGKTTLVQGIGAGLDVRGPITSPTFVIARVHPSLHGGPDLVHADAYRLGSRLEVDDLDLDADVDHSVTVVEWGEGLVEGLTAGHLRITIGWAESGGIEPMSAGNGDEQRIVTVTSQGGRWPAIIGELRRLLGEHAS